VLRADYGVSTEVRNRLQQQPAFQRRVTLFRLAEDALRAACRARPRQVMVEIDDHNHGFLLSLQHDGTVGVGRDFATAADADVNHGWHVQIDDDGDGFDPPDGGSVPGHLGLTAMRERAQIAGGWWKLESRLGSGTSISFWLPGVQQAPEFMLPRLSA
jgi:glucose-6-phosphate-specific signal transduction histidine kinase